MQSIAGKVGRLIDVLISYVCGCLGRSKKECEILMNHLKLTIKGHQYGQGLELVNSTSERVFVI